MTIFRKMHSAEEARSMREAEESYFADADQIVCISQDEAKIVRTVNGVTQVHVIPAHLDGLAQYPPAIRPASGCHFRVELASWCRLSQWAG